jgi:hypothetical protein
MPLEGLCDQVIKFCEDCNHWHCSVVFPLVAGMEMTNGLKTPFPARRSLKNLSSSSSRGRDKFGPKQNLQ